MKINLKLIFHSGGSMEGKFDVSAKKIKEIGLFAAIKNKVEAFNPKETLIISKIKRK